MNLGASSIVSPLVSVIIPCYNYGHFLAEAIESVEKQTYPAKEILVIDDGSTDSTREVAARYPEVIYIYQENQGLSAARNTGIRQSKGAYLVFLDADDWLLPDALATNVAHLQEYPQVAFVAGAHIRVFSSGEPPEEKNIIIRTNPYYALLCGGNLIGMIATVMFTRWVLQEFAYDPSLAICEDYDLYFKITRCYPIAHHNRRLAAYRIHSAAMSANASVMLNGTLRVLRRQREKLRGPAEIEAYYRGINLWHTYYAGRKDFKLTPGSLPLFSKTMALFLKDAPYTALRYWLRHTFWRLLNRAMPMLKTRLKSLIPTAGKRWLHTRGMLRNWVPTLGQVTFGDFRRPTPFSTNFGYDRGGPIDRYYIEEFLAGEAASIWGRVLEIGDNAYTVHYGAEAVHTSDILHIDATNPRATFVGDLSDALHLPDNTFDCIILTQTLQFIYDFRGALATCYRILKPGGTLLLTVPGLSPIDQGEWRDIWYWSFTDKALARLMAEFFADAEVTIGSFGNVWVATAFLYGMGITELTEQDLNFCDPQFQVINTVKATKPLPDA